MIQLRFVGLDEHGNPCFAVFDEDMPFSVEISARGEDQAHMSHLEGGLHKFGFALGAYESVCIEQEGTVVFVLHGEGVQE